MRSTNHKTKEKRAVIYRRVSSVGQTLKGHGLDSQETRCREFARVRSYLVEQVFSDEAVSGSLIDRPGMREMLRFLRTHQAQAQFVVIIDDISRLARDIRAHIELRTAIAATGAELESPSIEFGEGSDAQLVEHLLASVSQHQREKNAEQVRHRMGSRMMDGYWPFAAPLGYLHGKNERKGILVRKEPDASILQEAIEGFASERFETQADVDRFLRSHPAFPKSRKGKISNWIVPQILNWPLYAGYIEKTEWGVTFRKGKHEGLVSLATFERVKERLEGSKRSAYRTDLSSDFPLRGSVVCADCDKPLTSCWSRSKSGARHAYYMCFNRTCAQNRKSIRKDKIEGDFVALLDELAPTTNLFALVKAMFRSAWDQRTAQVVASKRACKEEIARINRSIDTVLDRIAETSVSSVLAAYERRVADLERTRLSLVESVEAPMPPKGAFEGMFEHAMRFLAKPSNLWVSGVAEQQKLAVRLAFSEKLAYSQKDGFRTPKTTIPFSMLAGISGRKKEMAEREGYTSKSRPNPRFPGLLRPFAAAAKTLLVHLLAQSPDATDRPRSQGPTKR